MVMLCAGPGQPPSSRFILEFPSSLSFPPHYFPFPKPRLHLPYYPPPCAIWVTLPCHYPR